MRITGLILVIIVLALLTYCLSRSNGLAIESFIATMQDYVLPPTCPDYAVSDGHKYYLIFNNKDFDGIENPLVFNSEAELRAKWSSMGCPAGKDIPVHLLRRTTNHRDPQESYDRVCAKRVANPKYHLDKCASVYGLSGSVVDENSVEAIKPIHSDDIQEGSNRDVNKYLKSGQPAYKEDNLHILNNLYDFLEKSNSDIMADYDIETCMIHEIAKDMPELGNRDNLLKYVKSFNNF